MCDIERFFILNGSSFPLLFSYLVIIFHFLSFVVLSPSFVLCPRLVHHESMIESSLVFPRISQSMKGENLARVRENSSNSTHVVSCARRNNETRMLPFHLERSMFRERAYEWTNNSYPERTTKKKKRKKEKKRKTTGTTGRKRRNVKPTRFGAETTSATQPGEIGVHELREYEFKASRLGMTARNSEIQEQRARYRPRHRLALPRGAAPHRSLYARGSYFRSLVRTHLIYGSVYASHRRGGRYRGGENVYIDYRRCERGTIECNQRRVRRGAALSALILNRGSCGCLECLSGIFLRLFVI